MGNAGSSFGFHPDRRAAYAEAMVILKFLASRVTLQPPRVLLSLRVKGRRHQGGRFRFPQEWLKSPQVSTRSLTSSSLGVYRELLELVERPKTERRDRCLKCERTG